MTFYGFRLSDADFRECIGTASAEFTSAFPDLPRANPLAASVALVTGDGNIIIEKRSRVDSRRRAYHVIAGYMERERDGSEPHPFDTLEREVREELGVDLEEAHLSATGLVCALYGSEVCFLCRLALSFDDVLGIQAGSGSDSEIETLEALYDSPPCRRRIPQGPPRGPRAARESLSSPLRPRGIRREVVRSGAGAMRPIGADPGLFPFTRSAPD